MNWEAIGAIGEVAGALAVVATLGYLAVQIRQNTSTVLSNTEGASSKAFSDWHARVAHSDDMADIWDKAFSDETDLTPGEKRKFMWFIAEHFLIVEGVHNQHDLDYLSGHTSSQHERAILGMLNNPLINRWWVAEVAPFSQTFRDMVDAKRSQAPDANWIFQKVSDI